MRMAGSARGVDYLRGKRLGTADVTGAPGGRTRPMPGPRPTRPRACPCNKSGHPVASSHSSGPKQRTGHHGLSVIPGATAGRKTTAPGSVGTNREVPRLAVRGGAEPGAVLPCPVTAAKTAGDLAWATGSGQNGHELGPGRFIYGPGCQSIRPNNGA